MNLLPHIFIPGVIGIPVFIYAFFKYPRYAIAGLIIAKPIIDLTRDYHMLLNINFLKIYAGLFVILGTIYIISNRPKILRHPISLIWLIFLGLNFISIFIISDAFMLIDKIKYFLSILTGFIALALFAHLFDYKKDKKFVLSIFSIAGIFPLLLWLIPVVLGNPIFSNDPLRRIIGPYHGFWHFNFYATQTFICCLAYLSLKGSSFSYLLKRIASKLRLIPASQLHNVKPSVFSYPHNFLTSAFPYSQNFSPSKLHPIIVSLKSIFVLFMLFISVAMVYTCYSKAGWITLVTILFVWFLLRKKTIQTVLIPVIVAVILFVNPFARDFQKTFDNEINYFIHGSNTKEMVFRGRLTRWERGMEIFNSSSILNKLLGTRSFIITSENTYLWILWNSGTIGFIVFIALLGLTGYLLINGFVKYKNPMLLMSIIIFIMFLVNSIGAYPMLTPNFQWFVWGTVGFILSKDRITVATTQ